jgi:Flp pilus assembly protein TadG
MQTEVFKQARQGIAACDPAMQQKRGVGHRTIALLPDGKAMKRDGARAQAMVEFALALPIFLLALYGLMEVGRLIFMNAAVASASREGARYASAWGDNGNGDQWRDCDGIRSAAMNVGFLLGLQKSSILIYYDSGPGTAQTSYCPSNKSMDNNVTLSQGQRVIVTVNATYNPVLPLFLPLTLKNMSSTTRRTVMGIVDLNQP